MMRFLDTHSCVQNYFDRTETEFCVEQLGYNDFHYLTPVTKVKIQDYYTVHFVVSGKGKLIHRKKEYNLGAGDIFVLPPNEAKNFHCYYCDEKDPWDYIFFTFKGSLVNRYLSDIGFTDDNPVRTCNNSYKLLPAFKEAFEKRKNGIPITYFETTSLILQLFQSAVNQHSPINSNIDIAGDAMNLIQLNFFNPDLTVNDISQMLFLSRSQVSRLFKERTGVTMISYINECRMKHAEKLLITTDLKATEICYMCGFKEYTYFLLQFKKRNGMTTSEYRLYHKEHFHSD